MHRFVAVCLLFGMLLSAGTAAAHHAGNAVAARTAGSYNPFLEGTGGPRKSFTYTFDWSHLDNSAGDVYLNQVAGEYAVIERFSVTARIPVLMLRMNFRPDKTGLGDVAAGVKGLIWEGGNNAVTGGLEFAFPTGSREDGTGSGEVGALPFVAYQQSLGRVQFFTSFGANILLAAESEPVLQPVAGLSVDLARGDVGVTAFLSLRTSIFLDDESFTPGSAKGLLVPGLIIYPGASRRLSISVSGTVSVIDTLSVRNGVILAQDSLALTEDVLSGASLEINYNF